MEGSPAGMLRGRREREGRPTGELPPGVEKREGKRKREEERRDKKEEEEEEEKRKDGRAKREGGREK
jgi:hypothetical protein